jgi:fatty-acyl-CoA synthase
MSKRANYTPLSPQSFLVRSARVYPDKPAIRYGEHSTSYREFFERACRLANGLLELGVARESNVALLAPNTPAHLEANYGVHMAGGSLVAINTRLSPPEIAYIVQHSHSRVVLVDAEYLPQLKPLLASTDRPEHLIVIEDDAASVGDVPAGAVTYEAFLAGAAPDYPDLYPDDENQTIALNYTSGTTGKPKGVMYTHRSVYLNALCNLLEIAMRPDSVYLWTLPMFHCSGWCYTWAVTALGATHVCLRKLGPAAVVGAIQGYGVTHLCGAPIVLQMIADGAKELGVRRFEPGLTLSTAAAPPSPKVIERMLDLNVEVIHVYGLTETYGPTTVCEIQHDWRDRPVAERARLMARQGVPYELAQDLDILDAEGKPVPRDGQSLGEVCMRGNIVMKGYFDDPEATARAMHDGWFHSGDLGVMHPDGYIELKDRAKDIIISGGENISTIEVENVLMGHPAVRDAAVVAKPDEKWGEVPVAFVALQTAGSATEADLIGWCRERLAHYKAPKSVIFEELPRTSTGKVQKFMLRERFWQGRATRIN